MLVGGAGRDLFQIDYPIGTNRCDVIMDFAPVDDAILLNRGYFPELASGRATKPTPDSGWVGDLLKLAEAQPTGGLPSGAEANVVPLDPARFVVGSKASAALAQVIYNPDTGSLDYDQDGTGPSLAVTIAILPKEIDLRATNLLIG